MVWFHLNTHVQCTPGLTYTKHWIQQEEGSYSYGICAAIYPYFSLNIISCTERLCWPSRCCSLQVCSFTKVHFHTKEQRHRICSALMYELLWKASETAVAYIHTCLTVLPTRDTEIGGNAKHLNTAALNTSVHLLLSLSKMSNLHLCLPRAEHWGPGATGGGWAPPQLPSLLPGKAAQLQPPQKLPYYPNCQQRNPIIARQGGKWIAREAKSC